MLFLTCLWLVAFECKTLRSQKEKNKNTLSKSSRTKIPLWTAKHLQETGRCSQLLQEEPLPAHDCFLSVPPACFSHGINSSPSGKKTAEKACQSSRVTLKEWIAVQSSPCWGDTTHFWWIYEIAAHLEIREDYFGVCMTIKASANVADQNRMTG